MQEAEKEREREEKRKLEPVGWAKGPSQEQCRSKFRLASVPCLSSCLSLYPLSLYLCSPYNTHIYKVKVYIYMFLISLRENGQVRREKTERERESGDDYYSTSSFTKFPRLNSGCQPIGASVSFSGSFIIERIPLLRRPLFFLRVRSHFPVLFGFVEVARGGLSVKQFSALRFLAIRSFDFSRNLLMLGSCECCFFESGLSRRLDFSDC